MQVLQTPSPSGGAAWVTRLKPLNATLVAVPPYPATWIFALLLSAVCTLPVLAFLNARGWSASAGMVGVCEAVLYVWCLALLLRRMPPWTLALSTGLLSWIVLTWLVRQHIDLKSVRDLMIPILFISLGRFVADGRFADLCLRTITALVLSVALFEVVFTSVYGQIFNPFAFYAGLGSIRESAGMFEGQTLTLNGFRPEGIGRTLLPSLLGSHRTSSLFLEPVSLGNFAVILMAWQVSHAWSQVRNNVLLMCLAAVVLVTLSDSRFGLVMVFLLVGARLIPMTYFRWFAALFPFAMLAAIISVSVFLPAAGDNLLGRIAGSGQALLRFDESALLGFLSPLPGFGDMGYAYVLSRFGVFAAMALVAVFFLIPMATERAERFRGLLSVYLFSSLAISGTSVFALKTAALMWFLFGAIAADDRLEATPLRPSPS